MSDANEMKADDAAIAGPSQEVQSGHSARNGAPDGTTHERFPGQLQMVNLDIVCKAQLIQLEDIVEVEELYSQI